MSVRRATIRDVAAHAGVSVATVSKVLNGRDGVAAATQQNVRAVIDDLGYESSLVARSLRNARTGVIGVLVADIEPFSAELLKGVARAVRDSDHELLVYSPGGSGREHVGWERRSLARLSGTLIDGAVMVTPTVLAGSHGFPVVAVDPHTGGEDVPTVDSDNLGGAESAVDHLLGLGHRRIAFVAGRPDLESARLRERGYRQALERAGLVADPDLVRVGAFEAETSARAARELLMLPDRPTAVFAANDLAAIRTVEVAASLGLSVPGDLSVVGFDDVPESVTADPPLTTVEQPIQPMGRRAVEMLLDVMAGREVAHVRMPTRLVVRGSTAPPSTGDGASAERVSPDRA